MVDNWLDHTNAFDLARYASAPPMDSDEPAVLLDVIPNVLWGSSLEIDVFGAVPGSEEEFNYQFIIWAGEQVLWARRIRMFNTFGTETFLPDRRAGFSCWDAFSGYPISSSRNGYSFLHSLVQYSR